MNGKFIWVAIACIVVTAIWCGCDKLDGNSILTKIPGTEGVDVWHPSLSLSPDGEFMVFITDSDRYENNGHRFDYQIESLKLRTGEVRRHHPSVDISKTVLERINRTRNTTGFDYSFREDSWRDGKFYIWVDRCIEIDPRREEYIDVSYECPQGLRSSDRVEREYIFEVEKKFRKSGAMNDAEFYNILRGSAREHGHLTMPTSVDRSKPVLYYVGAKTGTVVYRSNGKDSETVHKYRNIFYDRGIRQIKASPDGRYLAMIREKRVAAPIPVLGSGFDLTILDLGRDKKFIFKTSKIGSCVWAPDSETLYLSCSEMGDGVYRLKMSDAFK